MNKNSKRRQLAQRKEAKQSGGFPKPVFKAKKKPFPQGSSKQDVSLAAQHRMFYGI